MNNYRKEEAEKNIRNPINCSKEKPYTLRASGVNHNEREYFLTRFLTVGGSSLIYEAYTLDSYGKSQNTVLVKEYYPSQRDIFRGYLNRVMGDINLQFQNNSWLTDEDYERCRKEYDILNAVSTEPSGRRNMSAFRPIDQFVYKNNIYTVLETAEGEVLQDIVRDRRNCSDFIWNCKMIQCLIKREKELIEKGYLHLDISPDNIFMINGNDINCFLIDYNSAQKIDRLKDVTLKEITFKKSFSAPELVRCSENAEYMNDEALRSILTIHLDIYSITAVFYALFCGQGPKFEDIPEKLLDDNALFGHKAIEKINAFIYSGLQKDPKKRFDADPKKAFEIMDNRVSEIIKLLEEKYVTLCNNIPPNVSKYIPRWSDDPKEEYGDIIENLKSERMLFISGISGQGKSEYARGFSKFALENEDIHYEHVCFITFDTSFKQTIAAIPFINFDEGNLKLEDLYVEKLRLLGKLDNTNLLIIDNFNQEIGEDISIFDQGDYRIVFTTQNEKQGYGSQVPLKNMSEDRALILFEKNLERSEREVKDDEEIANVRQIIAAVGGHTMAIALIAAAIRENDITIKNMAEKLSDMGLPTDLEEEISFYKDKKKHEEALSEIFKMLFNLSDFDDEEKRNLRWISLMPVEGIPLKLFKSWAGVEKNSQLDDFLKRNWIKITSSHDKGSILSCHALAAKTFRSVIPYNKEDNLSLIAGIKTTIDEIERNREKIPFWKRRIIALSAYNVSNELLVDEDTNEILMSIGKYIDKNEYFDLSMEIIDKVILYRDQHYKNNQSNESLFSLNEALLKKCNSCYKGNKSDVAKHIFEAMTIIDQKDLIDNNQYLVQNIDYYAYYCWDLSQFYDDYDTVEELFKAADEIIPDDDIIKKTPELVRAVGNLKYNRGVFLFNINDYSSAEVQLKQSIELNSIYYGEGSLELCSAQNQLAAIKNREGDVDGSYLLYKKVLDQRVNYYGNRTTLVAYSYGQCAKMTLILYDKLLLQDDDFDDEKKNELLSEAKKYLDQGFILRRKYYDHFHHHIADAYNIQYMLYSRWWSLSKEKEEKGNYYNMAWQGIMEARKICDELGRLIGESQTYENEGEFVFLTTGDSAKAVTLYEKALELALQKLSPQNDRVIRIQNKIVSLKAQCV